MKILLVAINSKYIHSNPAVYSLRANAGCYADSVIIREFTINMTAESIMSQIYSEKADVLCFSVYLWNVEYVRKVSRELSKLCPDTPIWVGGPEVSYETEAFLKENKWITGVMIGEGEKTFKELCSFYIERTPDTLAEVKGLAINSAGKVSFSGAREPADMNQLVFAYDNMQDFDNRIVYYESSRGCPFSCSYCLSSVDKCLRFKDFDLVKEELLKFIKAKVPQVKFVDRTFNCNHEHAKQIWRFIKDNDNGITNFHFEISADLINEEELGILKEMRPGLVQLEIGVQTTNSDTINSINRKMNLERLKTVVKTIQSYENIHEHLDLIAGLPFEDFQSFKKSFNEVYALKPDQLQLGFLKVLKGAYIYDHVSEYGIAYNDDPPYEVLSTKWLSFDDIRRLKRVEEMLEVYYNSAQYSMTVKILELLFETPFDLFDSLGAFYEERGYFGLSHSRIRRAEIVLEFLENVDFTGKTATMTELVKEALVFDLYLRENCKTRPNFAYDMSSWKDVTHHFCEHGKLSHVEKITYDFLGCGDRALSALPTGLESPRYVLFSYEKRNALDYRAETMYVEMP